MIPVAATTRAVRIQAAAGMEAVEAEATKLNFK